MKKSNSPEGSQRQVSHVDNAREMYDLEIKIDQIVQALKLIRRYSNLRVSALDAVIEGLDK